jgi:protein SCO1/2
VENVVFPISASMDSLVLNDLDKQIIIVNFFYTKNTTLIPKMDVYAQLLNKEFLDNKMIRFISISIDPENDTQQVLADFAKAHGAVNGKWDFVTADTAVIYPLARKQFFVNALKLNDDDFIMSDNFILLDAEHRIRGYYDATSQEETKRLSGEIKVLITEELRKIPAEIR